MYQLRVATPQAAAGSGGKAKRAARKSPGDNAENNLRLALLDLQKRGFNRLYQSGQVHQFISPESLIDVDFKKPVYVLVDRLAVSEEAKSRLIDSVEICYREGTGEAIVEFVAEANGATPFAAEPRAQGKAERLVFNERFE
jgi:excinuclease ABC subunit A